MDVGVCFGVANSVGMCVLGFALRFCLVWCLLLRLLRGFGLVCWLLGLSWCVCFGLLVVCKVGKVCCCVYVC